MSVAFGDIDAPTPKVITSAVGNLQRLNLGRSSKVIMRNASTGQRVVAEYTVHQNDFASQYGGAYVWRVDGAYHKLYYNIAHGGRLPIESSYAYNKYEFY